MKDATANNKELVTPKEQALVAIAGDEQGNGYPGAPPFNPIRAYPEYPFETDFDASNKVYDMVRNTLITLGLDKENIGTENWNPFKGIVVPGSTVLIKPNLVKHFHNDGKSIDSVIVHAVVIRPVLDYVWIALKGSGKIVVADTPLAKTDFLKMCQLNGLTQTIEELRETCGMPVELIDLRSSQTHVEIGWRLSESPLPGDPLGYSFIDLGRNSKLADLDSEDTNYYTLGDYLVDHFDPYTKQKGLPNKYHNKNSHQYSIGNTVLNADTVISIAKLKTHKKAGVTLNLKNMIGIINGKAFIPHHRPGRGL